MIVDDMDPESYKTFLEKNFEDTGSSDEEFE